MDFTRLQKNCVPNYQLTVEKVTEQSYRYKVAIRS